VRRKQRDDGFQVQGVAERLADYETAAPDVAVLGDDVDEELVARAATLLTVLPGRQPRAKIELLLSPNDPDRGRRAVDALIASAFAAEDDNGRVRKVA
jgi:hypothetical protein